MRFTVGLARVLHAKGELWAEDYSGPCRFKRKQKRKYRIYLWPRTEKGNQKSLPTEVILAIIDNIREGKRAPLENIYRRFIDMYPS